MVNPEPVALGVDISEASLQRLAAIARAAGAVILPLYDSALPSETKADQSPITEADRRAHGTIVTALEVWDPSIPIVSEEGEIAPYSERKGWQRFWLVDPLDGTKEFLKHNGEFTVNIALIDGGEPVLGVVLAPAADLLYLGGRGLGAWRQRGHTTPEHIRSKAPSPNTPLTIVESRSHPSEALEAYLKTVRVAQRIQVGSSLKFCWVADGTADVYPRFGPTMEWDVAAGDCVFRCSGHPTPRVSPLTYNGPDLRNDAFIIGLD